MAVARNAPVHVVDQGGLLELAGRQVHPDLERHAELLVPRLHLAARLLQDHPPDWEDGAVVLGDLDELGGQQDAVVGVVPPHQCLGTDDPPVVEGDERLVVDLHLAALGDVVQRGVEIEPTLRTGADPVGIGHGELATAASLLDPVHGHVGIAQQLVAGLSLLAQRDPDAHGGDHLVPGAQGDRVAEGVEDGVRHLAGVIGRGDSLEQDHELVAAEAGQRVAGPDRTAQAVADHPQQLVPHLVAQVVVHDLEAVDVPEQHRHLAPRPVGLEQGVVEVVQEEPTVGQAGQGVLERLPGQLLFERLALRRVPEDDDGSRRGCAAPDRGRRHGDGEERTVEPLEAGVVAGDVAPQGDGTQGGLEEEVRRLAGRKDRSLVDAHAPAVPAQHACTRGVHEGDLARLADGAHALGRDCS